MLGLNNSIKFLGQIDNVENYLKNSDIYVHSAINEPFGLVLIEAMASGLPVICIDGKGNRDIVKQGYNGFILEQNSKVFSKKIIEVYKNKNLKKRLSNNSILYSKQFSLEKYIENLMKIYNVIS